jgi:hypothetical protein
MASDIRARDTAKSASSHFTGGADAQPARPWRRRARDDFRIEAGWRGARSRFTASPAALSPRAPAHRRIAAPASGRDAAEQQRRAANRTPPGTELHPGWPHRPQLTSVSIDPLSRGLITVRHEPCPLDTSLNTPLWPSFGPGGNWFSKRRDVHRRNGWATRSRWRSERFDPR